MVTTASVFYAAVRDTVKQTSMFIVHHLIRWLLTITSMVIDHHLILKTSMVIDHHLILKTSMVVDHHLILKTSMVIDHHLIWQVLDSCLLNYLLFTCFAFRKLKLSCSYICGHPVTLLWSRGNASHFMLKDLRLSWPPDLTKRSLLETKHQKECTS